MHRYVIKSMAKVTGRAWVADIQVFTGKFFQLCCVLENLHDKRWIKTTTGKANSTYGPDWSAGSYFGLCGLQHRGLTSTPQLPRSLGSFLCHSPSLNPQSIFQSHFFPCISKAGLSRSTWHSSLTMSVAGPDELFINPGHQATSSTLPLTPSSNTSSSPSPAVPWSCFQPIYAFLSQEDLMVSNT